MHPCKLLMLFSLTAPFWIACNSDTKNKPLAQDNPVEHVKENSKDIASSSRDDVASLQISDPKQTDESADLAKGINNAGVAKSDVPNEKPSTIVAKSTSDSEAKPQVKKETKAPVKKAIVSKPKPQVKEVVKPKKKPAIVFKELEYNFGEIYEGDEIKHEFIFKNTGNAPLEILSTDVTCGCTFPSYPFIAIQPGQTGHIGVSYKSVGKFGNQNPKISVKTNVSSQIIALYLKGFVKKKDEKEEIKDSEVNPLKSVNEVNKEQILTTKDKVDSVLNNSKEEGKELIKEAVDTTKKGS